MTYIVTSGIDLPIFATDLARELNATVLPAGDYPQKLQKLRIGDDELSLSADNYKKRINVSISAIDVAWNDRNMYNAAHRTPRANISPERPIAAIARDLKRRVIEPAQQPLALQRGYAQQQAQRRSGIVNQVAELKADLPAVQVRHQAGEQQASVYLNKDGAYIDGTINHDGSVSIRHIGSMSGEKFRRLVEVLTQ